MGDAIKYLIPDIVNTGNAFRSTKVIKDLKYGVVYWGGRDVYEDSNTPCRIRRSLLDK